MNNGEIVKSEIKERLNTANAVNMAEEVLRAGSDVLGESNDPEALLAYKKLETRTYEALKTWWVMTHNTEKCYGCAYCILASRKDLGAGDGASQVLSFSDIEIGEVPINVHSALNGIPVSINNYFGDPLVQWEDTVDKLQSLEEAGHSGPIGIISKSRFSQERAQRLRNSPCDVVVLQSISGLPKEIEPVSTDARIESLRTLVENEVPSIAYLRPIVAGHNDSPKALAEIIDKIADTGCRVLCYSGLRGTDEVIGLLENKLGETLPPPKGHTTWQADHKLTTSEAQAFIEEYAKKKGVSVFRKTSCAVTYALNLNKDEEDQRGDFNCHWSQPEKYGCGECPNAANCSKEANRKPEELESRIQIVNEVLGTKGKIIKKTREGACQLQKTCTSACSSCPISGGIKLKLEGEWSLGELSLARWLAGIPVLADKEKDTPKVIRIVPKKTVTTELIDGKVNPDHFFRRPGESACPQGCAYCIVDLNEERKREYDAGIEYFMNSFVAVNGSIRNREKFDRELQNFDWSKVEGDVVGFQGASEPMLFPKQLDFVCEMARKHHFRVAICTKATITAEKALTLKEKYGDVLEIEVSYAKLGELERTDKTRLATIKNLIDAGFEPLVVVQPYIYGLTDKRFDDLLNELQTVGARYVSINGFRYSATMEEWAAKVLPPEWLAKYKEHEGEEWLPDKDLIKARLVDRGFNYTKIGSWLRRNSEWRAEPPNIDEIQQQIKSVSKMMNFPPEMVGEIKILDGKIIISNSQLESLSLRVASDSNTECIAKTLSRRLNYQVVIQ